MGAEQTAVNHQGPGKSRMPPPLPFLVGVVVGLICQWMWPWPIAQFFQALPVGILLIGLVVVLVIALNREFKRHATPPDPEKETTALIVSGPFRMSRNPAYVSVAILHAAIGFLCNSVWVLLMIIPALIVIHHVVVLREEAYLESRFGEAYHRYKARVRRWI